MSSAIACSGGFSHNLARKGLLLTVRSPVGWVETRNPTLI